jgi:hypothetical protein
MQRYHKKGTVLTFLENLPKSYESILELYYPK